MTWAFDAPCVFTYISCAILTLVTEIRTILAFLLIISNSCRLHFTLSSVFWTFSHNGVP